MRTPLWQFQQLAEPLLPVAEPEAVTLDKWLPHAPDPLRLAVSVALIAAGTFAPPAVAAPPVDLWWTQSLAPVPTRPHLAHDASVSPPVVPPPVPEFWTPSYPDAVPDARPTPDLFAGSTGPVFVPAPALLDSWRPSYPDFVLQADALDPSAHLPWTAYNHEVIPPPPPAPDLVGIQPPDPLYPTDSHTFHALLVSGATEPLIVVEVPSATYRLVVVGVGLRAPLSAGAGLKPRFSADTGLAPPFATEVAVRRQ